MYFDSIVNKIKIQINVFGPSLLSFPSACDFILFVYGHVEFQFNTGGGGYSHFFLLPRLVPSIYCLPTNKYQEHQAIDCHFVLAAKTMASLHFCTGRLCR